MKSLFCIVGRSGTGKDTLVDNLLLLHPEWNKLLSKTTRPKRSETENCHIFTDEAEYTKDLKNGEVVAHTVYNGYHYWTTTTQVEQADLYIVDIPGLLDLKKKYNGEKKIIAIGLSVTPAIAKRRMFNRGDTVDAVFKRIEFDNEAFASVRDVCDTTIDSSMPIEAVVHTAKTIISVINNLS